MKTRMHVTWNGRFDPKPTTYTLVFEQVEDQMTDAEVDEAVAEYEARIAEAEAEVEANEDYI